MDQKTMPVKVAMPPHLMQQVSPDQVRQVETIVLKLLDGVAMFAPGQLGVILKNVDQFANTWLTQDWVVNLIVVLINTFDKAPTKEEFTKFVRDHLEKT